MNTVTRYVDAFFPPVIWAGIIFFLSSQTVLSGFDVSAIDFVFKKTAHMFVYAVLYILILRGSRIVFHKKRLTVHLLFPIFVALIYAISDELHQSLVPGRYATIRDIGYDMLGVGIAFLKMYGYI